MVSEFTATWISPSELHSAERYTGVTGFDTPTAHADAAGSFGTESGTKDFGRRKRQNWQRVEQRVRHVGASDVRGVTGQGNERRRDGESGARTASPQNSADQRSAGGPFDAGSPSPAVATNPEAYGLHRRDGRGTRQRNWAQTATLRRGRQTGLFGTRGRTRCGGQHIGGNRNGYERGWPLFRLPSVSLVGRNLSWEQ